MNLKKCHNFEAFRKLIKRNTKAFEKCDLIPNVLAGVDKPDLSPTIFGRKINMPIFLSPTAMQRLSDPEGD